MRMRLKAIIPSADFRKSEATLHDEFLKSRSYPGDLRAGECFLFLSKSGNQLLWFFARVSEILGYNDVAVKVYDSRRWRLTGGIWHPYMLANYAEMAGIELIGIKRFEEIIDERRGKR